MLLDIKSDLTLFSKNFLPLKSYFLKLGSPSNIYIFSPSILGVPEAPKSLTIFPLKSAL